jgi:cytochrome c oxidase cbb3-type subunit 3
MKKLLPVYVRIPVIFFSVMLAMEYFIDSGDRPAFVKFPMVSLFLFVFLFLLIAIEITMNAVDNITYHLLTDEQKAQLEAVQNTSISESVWYKNMLKALTKSTPIENENEMLLQHDYDGIKELDNTLPPWWVYMFYLTIVFAVVYLVRFHVMGGDTQEMELKNEIAQSKIEVAEYLKTAPDLMDEKTVTLLTEPAALAEGKIIYTTNCMVCHRADAGGQIGPNLTDDQWILGGGIKNVFHTLINGGRDGKGMISWKGTLKPKEMQKVASYILSLKGSNPVNPKASEGEIWVDEAAAKANPAAVIDTTQVKK